MLFAPGSIPRGPKVETKRALLLIDLQNDFVTPAGNLTVPNTANFVSKLPALIAKFRERGPVVWIQSVFRQPCPTVSSQTGRQNIILKGSIHHAQTNARAGISEANGIQEEPNKVRHDLASSPSDDDPEAFLSSRSPTQEGRCCAPNSKGCELAAGLASSMDRQKDIIFNKSQYSAFSNFSLVMQLRARMVNDLYICGSLSNIGVYATVIDAVQQGFNVTLVEDCLGYRNDSCHLEAMRRMADDFSAEGIDYQELMDDLYGLLGDVIPTSRFTRKLELSMSSQGVHQPQLSRLQKVNQWIDNIESDSETERAPPIAEPARTPHSNLTSAVLPAAVTDESSTLVQKSRSSPQTSPPRKRSTSDRDEAIDTSPPLEGTSGEMLNGEAPDAPIDTPSLKKSRTQMPAKVADQEEDGVQYQSRFSPARILGPSMSTGQLESRNSLSPSRPNERAMSHPNLGATKNRRSYNNGRRGKKLSKSGSIYLGVNDNIGDDSRIIHNVLTADQADKAFSKLKNEVCWQKMYHRTGEVPRLVAVQGTILDGGAIPIYRHPADESPPLLKFDENVDALRQRCEEYVGHELNHVLIQYYRNGEDNISEHSDKTLDIVRGSSIVNLSLGAMRTMTLRAKKVSNISDLDGLAEQSPQGSSRSAQRIRLPHNSLFILGERTNTNWLHAIRADKRPECEKMEEELAFNSERISLTFRKIGTFIDPEKHLIWGQGATEKSRERARSILQGDQAQIVGERLIIGFGQENHLNDSQFDWSKTYGTGFDVVNYEVRNGDNRTEQQEDLHILT